MTTERTIELMRTALQRQVASTINRLNQRYRDITNGGIHVPARAIVERDADRARWLIEFADPILTASERSQMRADIDAALAPVLALMDERTRERSAYRAALKSSNT